MKKIIGVLALISLAACVQSQSKTGPIVITKPASQNLNQ
jgi:hypothetical protein